MTRITYLAAAPCLLFLTTAALLWQQSPTQQRKLFDRGETERGLRKKPKGNVASGGSSLRRSIEGSSSSRLHNPTIHFFS